MAATVAPVVVVGAGIAGVSAVAALRAEGYAGPLVLLGDEPVLPYRRPTVSKGLVRGTQTLDQVLVKPEEWYAEERVDLRRGVSVVAVDVAAAEVVLDSGERVAWSRLVLATGGRARRLPGLDPSPRVLTLRSAADAAALSAALEALEDHVDRPVVVVGAGLVGAEIAASLHETGRSVVLLETAPLPLARVLPPVLGEVYADLHRSRGVALETGVEVAKVLDTGDRVLVESADGRGWEAGLVVVAIGLEPDLTLADSAGLDVGPERAGVLVDDLGRTSVAGVWATGDVALRPSSYTSGAERAEHWQSAQAHGTAVGRALAAELAGEDLPAGFDEVPWAWSDQHGLNLQITGWPSADHQVVLRGEPSGDDGASWVAFFVHDGVLRGAVGVGRARDIRGARVLVGQRARVDADLLADADVPVPGTVVGT